MSRTLYAEIVSAYDCTLSGHGSRELLTAALGGRPPVWSRARRAWCCQESTLRDALAAAEREGFNVVTTGPRAAARADAPMHASAVDLPEVGELLW